MKELACPLDAKLQAGSSRLLGSLALQGVPPAVLQGQRKGSCRACVPAPAGSCARGQRKLQAVAHQM